MLIPTINLTDRLKYPMIYLYKNFLLLVFVSFSMSHLQAQEVIRQAPCFDASMKKQADSLIESMALQGFKMVREAAMSMQNQFEMPVLVPFIEGAWYHVAFIGD